MLITPLSRDGRRAYFANPVLPVEADLLNCVLRQIEIKCGIAQRMLEIPAGPQGPASLSWRALYTEVARLHRFTAVVLTGARREATVRQARALFGDHQPNLKLGVRLPATADALAAADFVLVPLEADEATAQLEHKAWLALQEHRQPVLFLLRRATGLSDERLRRSMRALRAAGARHYGYDNDDFLAAAPSVLDIVGELNAHAIAKEP